MSDNLSKKQMDDVLKALDNILSDGPWEESNFLRVLGKNISEIREHLSHYVNEKAKYVKQHQSFVNKQAKHSEQKKVYISLYSSEGNKLSSWERILNNLPRQTTSRPIYEKEEDVKEVIRSKVNKKNEAYVEVYIHEADLINLSEDKTPKDKLGKNLLTLKDKTITTDNFNVFVHESGKYRFKDNKLTKIDGNNILDKEGD